MKLYRWLTAEVGVPRGIVLVVTVRVAIDVVYWLARLVG